MALNGKVQAQAMVTESDPQAVALGYKTDASKVDNTKYPKYAAGQKCDNCALYQGKAGSACTVCIRRQLLYQLLRFLGGYCEFLIFIA